MLYCVFFGAVIVLLNFYWYALMWKGLKRILEQKGIIKVEEGRESNYERVD